MSVIRCSLLVSTLVMTGLAGLATSLAQQPGAEEVTADTNATAQQSNLLNPQIVRLSYVQGDVRVSPGAEGERDGMAPWEQGAVNLPLETGFSVVTGDGRVEIEFEDASTLYLAPNSVLTFNELTTRRGVPQTEMALLTGTATLHLLPTMPGEVYLLRTPSDSLHVLFGARADARIDSYLDAMTLTPQRNVPIQLNSAPVSMGASGASFTYSHGAVVAATKATAYKPTEWDAWVAARQASRAAQTAAVMKEAGLETALPGLADMNAKGRFFPCEPYGTCWEPTNGWARRPSAPTADGAQLQNAVQVQSAVAPQSTVAPQSNGTQPIVQTIGGGGAAPAFLDWDDDFLFPCSPFEVREFRSDFGADFEDASYSGLELDRYSYRWAVCHAGSWIQRNGRYAWVVGTRRHHHCPVRWVKTGGKLGYVPIHPRDVAGKEPLNLTHGVFVPVDRKQGTLRLARYEPGKQLEVLPDIPKQFRKTPIPALAEVKPPTVAAHVWNDTKVSGKTTLAEQPVNTIAFDRRAQSFTLVTRMATGEKVSTISSPMGGRVGTPQGSGPIFRGGYSTGPSNSGTHATSSGGSLSSSGSHVASGGSFSNSGGATASAASSAGAAHK